MMDAPYIPGFTHHETLVLETLRAAQGQLVRYSELGTAVYGYSDGGTYQAIRTHVSRLRRKLGRDAISNIWGYGYAIKQLEPCEHCAGTGVKGGHDG